MFPISARPDHDDLAKLPGQSRLSARAVELTQHPDDKSAHILLFDGRSDSLNLGGKTFCDY